MAPRRRATTAAASRGSTPATTAARATARAPWVRTAPRGHLPAVTSQFTDYALMQRQVAAFAAMEAALAVAPAAQLGVAH
jgi:hypothetical protein